MDYFPNKSYHYNPFYKIIIDHNVFRRIYDFAKVFRRYLSSCFAQLLRITLRKFFFCSHKILFIQFFSNFSFHYLTSNTFSNNPSLRFYPPPPSSLPLLTPPYVILILPPPLYWMWAGFKKFGDGTKLGEGSNRRVRITRCCCNWGGDGIGC